ncbi:MAG: serine hydrolase [Bacteroidia bacterium]|nr:serine hydrolase [Bacteroidia bacterium]
MKRLIFLLLAMVSIGLAAQSSKKGANAPDNRFAGLDTTFTRVLKEWKAAGFAVAVVEKNKVVWSKGYGYRDLENKLPVTPNTQFAIGSCTKAFTSTIIGMLNKEGKVEYDKPVRTYLPDLRFFNDEMNDKITLRDMMCHRTGLPRHDYSWYLFTTDSRDSIMQRIQYLEPSAGLREKYQYNSFMFFLQGMVAEKLTGKSWEENVRERIFTPLGMTNTNFSVNDMAKNAEGAVGYDVLKDSVIKKMEYYNINAMGPAGSINSSVMDMAKWVAAWINDGKADGKELIPSGYRNEAISGQMIMSGGLPDSEVPDVQFSNYGFAWILCSYRGHYRVEHDGNIDGFSARTCFFPSDSIGIIVLANQNGSAVPGIVRNYIADRLLKEKYIDWSTINRKKVEKGKKSLEDAEKSTSSNRKTNAPMSHPIKDYEGIYTNKGYGSFTVALKNDSLLVQLKDKSLWMHHYHYDVFDAWLVDKKEGIDTVNQEAMKVQFVMNVSGDIESASLQLEPTIKPLIFTRTAREMDIKKDDLSKYVGDYELAGIVMKFYVKGEKTLYCLVPGQPEYELSPIEKDRFALKIISGYYMKFGVNEKGEVTDVTFQQPNGNFKATRKK